METTLLTLTVVTAYTVAIILALCPMISRASAQVPVNSCDEESSFTHLSRAYNIYGTLRKVHDNCTVFVTSCINTTASCRGSDSDQVTSSCKQKTGWARAKVQPIVMGTPVGQFRWEWIAINRSCNCAVWV